MYTGNYFRETQSQMWKLKASSKMGAGEGGPKSKAQEVLPWPAVLSVLRVPHADRVWSHLPCWGTWKNSLQPYRLFMRNSPAEAPTLGVGVVSPQEAAPCDKYHKQPSNQKINFQVFCFCPGLCWLNPFRF